MGVIVVVLTVSALASGLVERSPLSFPMMFLGLGFLLGRGGLGATDIGPHTPFLEVVATLTLALVLFLDAVKLQIGELGKGWLVPALILGPGTGIIIGLGAAALALLLGFPWLMAFIGGAVLSGILGSVSLGPALILAALVIFLIRPPVLALVLSRAKVSWEARAFVAWFGPRGLNSLLLALLVVQAGIPGSKLLLETIGVVVLASVIIHGAAATPFGAWDGLKAAEEILDEEREATVAGLLGQHESEVPRISIDELAELMVNPEPPMIIDGRARASYELDKAEIPGSIRVLPDEVLEWVAYCPDDKFVVAYCG